MQIKELSGHPLIIKYFGRGECLGEPKIFQGDCRHTNCMALRILSGMYEPIQKFERVLIRPIGGPDFDWEDTKVLNAVSGYHPNTLRLPDAFQSTKECDCHRDGCPRCPNECPYCKPDPVEVLREAIISEVPACDFRRDYSREWLSDNLNRLVDLARSTKESK